MSQGRLQPQHTRASLMLQGLPMQAVGSALASGMVRATAVYDVLASIRGRTAQFNTNNVWRTRASGSCYRWLARSVWPRLSSGRSLGSGARRRLAAARRLGATTSGTAYTTGGVTEQHAESECSCWYGRCFTGN